MQEIVIRKSALYDNVQNLQEVGSPLLHGYRGIPNSGAERSRPLTKGGRGSGGGFYSSEVSEMAGSFNELTP